VKEDKSWFDFFFFWILVNTIGWFAFSISNFYVALFAVGLLIAWLQYLVLKHYFELDDQAWVWLSFLFYGASYALILSVGQIKSIGLIFVGIAVIFGVIGYLQRRSLDFYFHHTRLWLAASPLAGCIGLLAAIVEINLHLTALPHGMFEATFGCAYSIVTGITILLADKLPIQTSATPK